MKYLRKYESLRDFIVGDYVKMTSDTIKKYLHEVKEHPGRFASYAGVLTFEDIRNKIFIIEEIRMDMTYNGKRLPYKINNIDKNDPFKFGWTSKSSIRNLTRKEKLELNIWLTSNKYNL